MKFHIALAALILFNTTLAGQDRILLMNGSDLECRMISDSGTIVVFELTGKNGRVKQREIHKSDIFSYTPSGGEEHVFYIQDSLFGDVYSEDQMRIYMAGERDGRSNYKAWPTALAGVILCGAATTLGGDGFITLIAPGVLYTLIHLIPKIHIREKYMSNPGYKYNDIYADGFEPPARSKKMMAALGGGYTGSAIAILVYYILK